jgi:hypothetical protein
MTSSESDPVFLRPSAIPRRSVDRFLWGFPVFALGCEVFLAALKYLERINGSFIVTLLYFALVLLIMLAIALAGIIALIGGGYKRAAALLLAPLIVAAPFLFPILRYEEFVFDLIRFHFTKGTYAEVVDKLSPAERASRILFFDWGKEGLAGISGSSEYWLVYDESGEIALMVEERSQAWKDRANKEKGYFSDEKCLAEARRLGGHYYSAAMRCPY